MRTEDVKTPADQSTRLADYRAPDWLIDTVNLSFDLRPEATRVRARMNVRRNPARAAEGPAPLRLDGEELKLIRTAVDQKPLPDGALTVAASGLTVAAEAIPQEGFTWECEVEIDPKSNTALNGLYMSRDMYCTQCEAEGFRKIVYYPDRPDVMSVFTVRIEADKAACPVLLSNGNPDQSGDLDGGRHFVEWADPHPKPAYLFALVAGALVAHEDVFATGAGRLVKLAIFVRPGDEDKCAYAMDALKRAMKWDEETYGLEYDLDLFLIVAVDDFNMGAMENKGLNIFNSKYILASPETATDRDYELIEGIIAHEYFHNWTGNRITCRDWFQLCLKEGLTVFRDQQFSADQRSAAVKRIKDVKTLRARQFREDAGPLSHPVRPEEYIEINNFYTATIYEKGAEVVRMLRTLVGPQGYRKSLDLYFKRHDGQACTIEQFLKCFEDAVGRNLKQFSLWYAQAGTPRLIVDEHYDPKRRTYALTFRQKTPPTPGQSSKLPLVIPIAFGLLTQDGREIEMPDPANPDAKAPTTRVLEMNEEVQTFIFKDMPGEPVPSLLRGFSAPVILERKMSDAERAFLLAHDPDPFNRWEAGRVYALDMAMCAVEQITAGHAPKIDPAFIAAMKAVLLDDSLDPAFRALVFEGPSEDEMARVMAERTGAADPDAIHAAARHVKTALAAALSEEFMAIYDMSSVDGPYRPDANSAGARSLRNRALDYLVALGSPDAIALAVRQFRNADNMTDAAPALTALAHSGAPEGDTALAQFRERWGKNPLVMAKWAGIQASSPQNDALERIIALAQRPDFDWRNPNTFRALIGVFAAANPSRFHAGDGAGYAFVADWLIKLDPVNPQTTARVVGAFETWRRYDTDRQALIETQLRRILASPGVSKDTGEIIGRIIGA